MNCIKVCGMRDAHNIREVEALGIDMMGFIFAPQSPRYLDAVPAWLPRCSRVGVFVNAAPDEIIGKSRQYRLTHIQLHGNETPQYCRQIRNATGLHVIKATTPQAAQAYEDDADMFIFDTPGGGTGTKFDWTQLDLYHGNRPFLLAGGIGPDDAQAVAAITHPQFAGVDLNSRFEIRPGLKDPEKIRTFIKKIRQDESHKPDIPE